MINDNISDIIQKYILIKCNYKKLFFNSVINFKNIENLQNIYYKGTNLITNVFNISLLYLDSLVDIYNLCEKAFVYFIEFVNQINLTLSTDSSFELTLRDAVIFSYKKTIFAIDNKLTVYSNESINNKLKILEYFTNISNKLFIIHDITLFNLFHKYNINKYRLENKYNDFLETLNTYINKNIYDINKIIKKLLTTIDVDSTINLNHEELFRYIININSMLEVVNTFLISNNVKPNILDQGKNHDTPITIHVHNILLLIDKIISKKLFCYNIDYKNILTDDVFFELIQNQNQNQSQYITSIIKSFT